MRYLFLYNAEMDILRRKVYSDAGGLRNIILKHMFVTRSFVFITTSGNILLLFRKNRRGARSVILQGHRSVKILIPRRCTSVSLTRNVVCRRYTNITRVKITRVIFDPGQNDGSVDAAIVTIYYCIAFVTRTISHRL